jgi:SPOR domain
MADDTYSRGYRNDPYDRGGTGASGPPSDPLTELARLIGQSDPFVADRNRQPDPRQADPRQADPRAYPTDWRAGQAQHPQHYDNGAQDDRYGRGGGQQKYADNGYGAGDGYASYQNDPVYPQAGEQGAGYGNASGYGEPAYHPDQQGYHQDHQAYHQGQQAYHQDPQAYAQDPQTYHQDPQTYHQDPQAYHQDPQAYLGGAQGAPGPEGYQAGYQGGHQDAYEGGYDAAQADPHGGHSAPPFYGSDPDNERPDDYYDDGPAPRRGWLVTAAALVGLAVVGTAGAFAYRAVFTGGGQPSIITRDVGPSKITPSLSNPDNGANKAIDRLASAGQNERLGPPPEQPIAIPDPARTAPPPVFGQTQNPPAPALPPVTAPSQPMSPADTGPANGGAPRKVRTEKIKPDQLGDAGQTRPVGPPPRVIAPAPSTNASNAPLSLSPQGVSNASAPVPPMHTTALAPPPAADRGGGGGGYYVQVSAQKSEEEAKSSFRGIQAHHASLLGGQQAVIRRKDLGGKGVFYGAQVGPFSREAASKLCEDLKAAGQSCMIQRN